MAAIVVVGLGPGGRAQLTREAEDVLAPAAAEGRLVLRTRIHPIVEDWAVLGEAPSQDHRYDAGEDFEAVYDRIAWDVLQLALARGDGAELVYAVPGHPAIGEATVARLRVLCKEHGVTLRMVAGLSFVDAVCAAVGQDGGEGLRVADALALGRIDPTVPLLVCQVYSRRVASAVKIALGTHYPDEHEVLLVCAAGVPGQEHVERRALLAIDRDDTVDHLTSLWVPPLAPLQAVREPATLVEVMAQLRAPQGGCPWDKEQSHESLRKYLLEETYEALEALDAGNPAALEEELGDLLLQIVFHAQIADEAGQFDFGDVVAGISRKMIRRHPHVFAALVATDAGAVLRNWEALKRSEREARAARPVAAGQPDALEPAEPAAARASMLDGVPKAMPALAHSQAVQARAARVGFDWPNVDGVLEKVAEEAREVAAEESFSRRQEELGDLFFVLVRLASWLGVDAEDALRAANQKFRKRFAAMERLAASEAKTLEQYDASGLDRLWLSAKER